MDQSQGKTAQQWCPPLLIDVWPAVMGGNGRRVEQGGGQRAVEGEILQRLALQGRKARGVSVLPLMQTMTQIIR